MRHWRQLAALPLCLLWIGCGIYSFSGAVPGHLKSVAVPTFENETAEFAIAEDMTADLIDEFTRDGTLKVRDTRDADSILHGSVVRISDVPNTISADETVNEYRVTISVRVRYEDLVKGKVVWEETISQYGLYPFSGGSRTARETGVEEAMNKIVEEILNKTVSGW